MSRNKFKFHVIYLWTNLYSGQRIIFITHHLCLNMTRPVISVRNVFWIYYNISFIVKKTIYMRNWRGGKKFENHAIDSSTANRSIFQKNISLRHKPQLSERESWKEILYIPDRKFRTLYIYMYSPWL